MRLRILPLLATLAFRNVLRNPRRSLLTFAAISVGLGSALVLAALARGMAERMARDAMYTLTGHVQIHAPGFRDDPVVSYRFAEPGEGLRKVLGQPPVVRWSTRVRVPAVLMSERDSAGISLVGIDPESEKGLSFAGDPPEVGRALSDPNDPGIVVGQKMLEVLQTEVGKRIVVMTQDVEGHVADRGFRIVGAFDTELEATERSYGFVGRATAQKFLGIGEEVSEIALITNDYSMLDGITASLREAAQGLDVSEWRDLEPLISAMLSLQDGFLTIWFVIVIVTVAFGLVNTLFMAIMERTREIGLVQALGLRPRALMVEVVIESLVLLVLGSVAGVLFAFGGIYLLRDGIDISQFAEGAQAIGLGSIVYPTIHIADFVVGTILVLLIGVLSSVYPAWRSTRLNPVEALRQV